MMAAHIEELLDRDHSASLAIGLKLFLRSYRRVVGIHFGTTPGGTVKELTTPVLGTKAKKTHPDTRLMARSRVKSSCFMALQVKASHLQTGR